MLTRMISGAILLMLLAVAVQSLPDLVRYMKIRQM